MNFKTIASTIALTSAMLLSGGAYAQTTIGGATISADDLPKVQERCNQLAEAGDPTATPESAATSEDGDDTADSSDGSADAPEAVNEAADATTAIDLSTLTVESCTEAGFIKK